jgi:exodeoxyribonuclease-3
VAGGVGARRRLPAGAEDVGRDLPRRRPASSRLQRHLARAEGLQRSCHPRPGSALQERRRGLPGDPDDTHSRYIEAEAHGLVVASIYLPNGNPQPGPKFDYKLAWFDRLREHAASLVSEARTVVLAGDYNVVATDEVGDIYSPRSYKDDALLQPESRAAWGRLLEQGWTDAIDSLHHGEPIYTYWDYFRNRFARNAGLRIDHLLLNAAAAARLEQAGVDREVRAREKPSDHAPTWIMLRD